MRSYPRSGLALVATGAFVLGAAYIVSLLPIVRGDSGTVEIFDVWLNLVVKVAVVAVVAVRGWADPRLRWAWWLLALGLFAAFLGSAGYYGYYRHQDPVPFPSLADAGFIGFYVFVYAAVILMLRDRIWPFPRSMWLDGLIAGFTAAAFAAAFVLEPALRLTHGDPATVAVTLAYPVADLVLVMFLAGAFVFMGSGGRAWGWLATGLMLLFVTDGIYVQQAATGDYQPGDPLDIGWTAARLCFILAALSSYRHGEALSLGTPRVLVAPTLCAAASLALLYAGTRSALPPAATTLALAGALTALLRAGLALAELRRAVSQIEVARGEAEAANAAKTAFVSRISHELRTPLNSVVGFAQLLERDLQQPQKERAEHILAAGRHLTETINDLLDLASFDRREFRLLLEPVLATDVLRQVLDLTNPLIEDRELSLEVDVHAGLYVHVWADYTRLRQVLLNLVSNAVKYNRRGGAIKVTFESTHAECLRFVVADTGPGIAEKDLALIFEPFERLGAETGPEVGTGLGLSVARSMVEAMGGRLAVVSEPGSGSTFSVELRTVDPDAVQTASAVPGSPQLAELAALDATILYVEDNPANVELVRDLLSHGPGIDLLVAATGAAGLDVARSRAVDLILLDINLPDIDGFEVLRSIRSEPRIEEVPVVVVSADGSAQQRERLLSAGAERYVEKPIDTTALTGAILSALAISRTPTKRAHVG